MTSYCHACSESLQQVKMASRTPQSGCSCIAFEETLQKCGQITTITTILQNSFVKKHSLQNIPQTRAGTLVSSVASYVFLDIYNYCFTLVAVVKTFREGFLFATKTLSWWMTLALVPSASAVSKFLALGSDFDFYIEMLHKYMSICDMYHMTYN